MHTSHWVLGDATDQMRAVRSSAYVQKIENVVATENGAWMAKLGKASD